MLSPCLNEASEGCFHGCCPTPLSFSAEHNTVPRSNSTCAASRRDFAAITSSSIFPSTHFTNNESLPSLQESFSIFTKAYPQYYETNQIDQTRAREYYNLTVSNHTCLDYTGIGLFSYSQLQNQDSSKSNLESSASSSAQTLGPVPRNLHFPFFSISYKTGNLKTQLLCDGQESELESAMKKRIMRYLNISETDYSMVLTANRTSAFRLLAESYPFQSNKKLLTVYDHESEAEEEMIKSSGKRGARIMSAEFSWPRLRIRSTKMRKMLVSTRKTKKKRGLFVFPLHSKITGARYPYLWLSVARENNWHVLVDACAMGPKQMDSFGLSLFKPDILVSSFYNVFGENPSGFGCLFVKKSTISILETSSSSRIVNIVPPENMFQSSDDFSGTQIIQGEPSKRQDVVTKAEPKNSETSEIVEPENGNDSSKHGNEQVCSNENSEVECKGLDQVDSLGLILIANRARCQINWLVSSLTKLKHPNSEAISLVQIYGPKVRFDRGPALAFNVFDWKGEKVEPVLVQKLADRSNISVSYGFLRHIWFSDKYTEEKRRVLERRESAGDGIMTEKKKMEGGLGITVVTAALGFLTNFQDTYKLWAFIAQFLDADFVENERWRYTALNQKTIEV